MSSVVRKIMLASKFATLAICLAAFTAPSFATGVTNMTFAGGCPEAIGSPCVPGSNATETNVALLLGVIESDVTQIFSGFTVDGLSPPDTDEYSDNFPDTKMGSWSVSNSSITHLAFKSNGYYILGELTGSSGDWDNDTSVLGGWDITLVDCPAAVCGGAGRAYVEADFLNNGGSVAGLSNIRAFNVVPIPAAVWLFGSALAALGWAGRSKVKA